MDTGIQNYINVLSSGMLQDRLIKKLTASKKAAPCRCGLIITLKTTYFTADFI
jgi:hypothetical protein